MTRWLPLAALTALLLLSNAFWLYRALDQAVTASYRDQVGWEQSQIAQECLAAMPALAAELSEGQVVARLSTSLDADRVYEKEGVTVVSWLTLHFEEGRLVEAGSVVSD